MHRALALRKLYPWMALSVALACALPGQLHADPIVNGGFEAPVLVAGGAITFSTGQTLPLSGSGWTVVGDPGTSIYLLQDTYTEPWNDVVQFNAEEGFNSVDLSGPGNVGPSAGVEQTVPVTGGAEYTLSFYVGRVTPSAGPGGVYPTAATVDVSIDGGPRVSFTNADVINGRISWKQFNYVFTPAGNSTTIAFLNGTPANCNQTGLDNVSLTPTTGVGVGDAPGPTTLTLAPPSPNPARDATALRYTLSRAGHVRLAVYDVTGRMVRLLLDDEEIAGAHGATLQLRDRAGRELASGVYLVRLEAEGRALTRRIAAFH